MKSFWFVFLLCLAFFTGEGAKGGDGSEHLNARSKERKGKSLPTKGKLTTKDNHACSWNVTGEEEFTLQVSCSYQGGNYWCTYTGRPWSCPTYNIKTAQYWKQVMGKVKRKKHACEGDKTLKTRICKKAPTESQMRLKGKSWHTGKKNDERYWKDAARKKSLGELPAEQTFKPGPVNSTETHLEKNRDKSEASESTKSKDPSPLGEMSDEKPEIQEELSRAYCAEKWHSLCSFFVNLWNG